MPIGRLERGFTLIEVMVVMAVVAILASLIAPNYMDRVDDAREVVLRQNLLGLRQAIDQFYRDKDRYPAELGELVEKRYLRALPVDPLTDRSDTWVPMASPESRESGVFDVHSGAKGAARDGSAYASW